MEKSALLLLLTRNANVWLDSLAGPVLILVAQPVMFCAAASSLTVWSPPLVKPGASLIGLTVMVKFGAVVVSTPPLSVPPLSLKESVTVALPKALAAGVKVKTPAGDTA